MKERDWQAVLRQKEAEIASLKADKYESMQSYKKAAVQEIESVMDKLLEKNKQIEVSHIFSLDFKIYYGPFVKSFVFF
jgi:uncharacterized Zn finger protein